MVRGQGNGKDLNLVPALGVFVSRRNAKSVAWFSRRKHEISRTLKA